MLKKSVVNLSSCRSVSLKFFINEKNTIEFRAEAFDLTNHANWSGPGLNPTASTFGKVTGKTGLSRNLQLSLRYAF